MSEQDIQQELNMSNEKQYQVTVTFVYGARATIRMASQPVIPASIWTAGARSWIGESDGRLELAGEEIRDIFISRIPESPHSQPPRGLPARS